MNNDRISRAGRCIALAGLFGLIFFAAGQPAQAERKGAELRIVKTDASQVQGELIAVRGESLLLLEDGLNISVELGEIDRITIVKKSQMIAGLGYGFAIGGSIGYLVGHAQGDSDKGGLRINAGTKGFVLGCAYGALAGVAGLIAGWALSRNQTVPLTARETPEGKAAILERLNQMARRRMSPEELASLR